MSIARVGSVAALVVLAAFTAMAGPPASATYPGTNGLVAYRSGGDLWTVDSAGGNPTMRIDGGGIEYPSFGPSGMIVVFDDSADGNIYRGKLDGSKKRLTSKPSIEWGLDLGPNGRVVFVCSRASEDLCTVSKRGKDYRILLETSANEWNPTYSPNGNLIAYSSDKGGDHEIWVMRADGTHRQKLTSNSGQDLEPDFAPGGNRITFTTFVGANDGLATIGVNGNGLNLLDVGSLHPRTPVYAPDGTTILFASGDGLDLYEVAVNLGGAPTLFSVDRGNNLSWQSGP